MRANRILAAATVAAVAALAVSALAADKPAAPEPLKPIDKARFFTGRWYEIARTPMNLTKNCVAGTTDYYRTADGDLIDRDACRMGSPEGKEKVFFGPVKILNPGLNNKVEVHYKVAAVFYIPKTYWMLDHGQAYHWFIVSDPALKNVSIFTRDPRPPEAEVQRLVAEVAGFGYDPARLEFPTPFPPGEGQAPAAAQAPVP